MTGPKTPFVSVIVPCRNEARYIRRFIKALLDLQHPREKLEIHFVDGLSTDGTKEMLAEAAQRHVFIRVLDNPRMIVPVAMNLGIRQSRGEFIVRMDAHSVYPPDYLGRCVGLLRETGAASAGGRAVNVPNGEGPWSLSTAFVTAHVLGVGNSAWRTGLRPGFVDTVPTGAFPRALFEEVGLFDERLTRGQDHEMNARIRRRGYKIAFDPSIRILYWNQGTLRGLLRQGFYTSIWNVYTLALHPYTWKWRRFIPAAFVLYLASLAAGALAWAGATAAAPLAAYVLLVAGISFHAGAKAGGAARAAVTFTSYHLCYGAGTLFGLAYLISGRWRSDLGRPLR